MSHKFFITGTDTNIGKTYISVGLLKAFANAGLSTIGLKPLASGAIYKNNKLVNEDAVFLNETSTIKLNYEETNPFLFKPFISPNIAARQENTRLTLRGLINKTDYALNFPCDVHIVEGIGGWYVPLNKNERMSDFAIHYQMPVIIVVGIKLGCINHALLTYEAIHKTNLPIAGWIANSVNENESATTDVVASIREWLEVPFLGLVNFNQAPETVLSIEPLFNNQRVATGIAF